MFKILKQLLLGHKHNWQYYLARDYMTGATVRLRVCHHCKKWQVFEEGEYIPYNGKPHWRKGTWWVELWPWYRDSTSR